MRFEGVLSTGTRQSMVRSKASRMSVTFVFPLFICEPVAEREAAEDQKPKRSAEEEIIVTSSRIHRKDLTTPAPVTVITREQIEQSGRFSFGDFRQLMPEQGNAFQHAGQQPA